MKEFTAYSEKFRITVERELAHSLELISDSPLKEKIAYVFTMGGKRVRPLMTIFAAEAVGKADESVVHAAVAIEILHNFTLVHDDIMDNAGTRRGKETVHIRSGVNTAILVGDLMMALAYDCLEKCDGRNLREALRIFNLGVKQVCDGQALDESLSKCVDTSLPDYLDMISKKTGALLTAAGGLGALLGGGTPEDVKRLSEFGLNIGIAFQILDDVLDLEGDSERFGKPRGLDIIEKKKNYLFLKAQQSLDPGSMKIVDAAYKKPRVSAGEVDAVRDVYRSGGIFDAAMKEVEIYTGRALRNLDSIRNSEGKDALVELANSLVQRKF